VNYHATPVKIGPATINVASVGSVCTDPAYRGRKLASNLLVLAEEKMLRERIHVVVISGEGGIYTAYGSGYAGDMREVTVPAGRLTVRGNVTLASYDQTFFPAVRRLHDAEAVRFVRKSREFSLLIAGQTYPDTFADYPFEMILRDGVPVAYAVVVREHENDEVGIKEMAGDREAIAAAFPLLIVKYRCASVHFATAPDDPLLAFVPADAVQPIHQFASFKIVDFTGLMERLKPYFRTMLGSDANRLGFAVAAGAAVIEGFGETLRITDPITLAKIVFGCAGAYPSGAAGKLAETLSRIYPVPFPWTHALNYQ
jgi:hypothetical protein